MSFEFIDILRQPDSAVGATDASPFRFEERACGPCSDVKYTYEIRGNSARITVYPSGSPVKYLKLRFRGDLSFAESVYGEQWERVGMGYNAEWRSIAPYRGLPWFCYIKGDNRYACYGVKTGPDCFPFWQVDSHGITLFLNLCIGNDGTDLKEPLIACEVVQYVSDEGADAYLTAQKFSKMMCDSPLLPKEQIFGVNNWYWAYGKISRESVLRETDYLMKMCEGTKQRPYMIIDDGWQYNRTHIDGGSYIGGPWEFPNSHFGNMAEMADEIHAKGAKCGIWFRPALTLGEIPEEARLARASIGGLILDPTQPYTLERVEADAARLRSWGYDVIKHDFTTIDIVGVTAFSADKHHYNFVPRDRIFHNKTKTTATVIKDFYKAIQRGAGDADVIGCNTISHLTAGIHSTYRTGNDTSGRSFALTHHQGVNSVMRLPHNDAFYRVDPDCAAFTEKVDADINLDYLEMCAITGMTTLASVTPGILTDKEMERINKIYRTADEDKLRLGIKNYDKTSCPEIFVSEDGSITREFDWEREYDGARVVYNWMQ